MIYSSDFLIKFKKSFAKKNNPSGVGSLLEISVRAMVFVFSLTVTLTLFPTITMQGTAASSKLYASFVF